MFLVKVIVDNCKYCQQLNTYLKNSGKDKYIQVMNASKEEGLNFAKRYGITKAPSLVLVDEDLNFVESCLAEDITELRIQQMINRLWHQYLFRIFGTYK